MCAGECVRCGEEDEGDQGRQSKRGFVLSLKFGEFRGEFPLEGETKADTVMAQLPTHPYF